MSKRVMPWNPPDLEELARVREALIAKEQALTPKGGKCSKKAKRYANVLLTLIERDNEPCDTLYNTLTPQETEAIQFAIRLIERNLT